MIGRWLKRDPAKRDKVVIATKVGFIAGLAPETIARGCEASLRRLGIERIDLYYHHKDDPKVPLADSLGAMDALVKAGKVRAVGLSQYSAERLDEAMRVADANGFTRPCALQTWYNLVEREKLEGPLRDAALRTRPWNHSLLRPRERLPHRQVPEPGGPRQKHARRRATSAISKARGCACSTRSTKSMTKPARRSAAIALAWTNAQPGIAATLASATSLEQLSELTAAMELELSADQIARLDEASAETEPASA